MLMLGHVCPYVSYPSSKTQPGADDRGEVRRGVNERLLKSGCRGGGGGGQDLVSQKIKQSFRVCSSSKFLTTFCFGASRPHFTTN